MAREKPIDGTVQVAVSSYLLPNIDADLGVEFLDGLKLDAIEDGIRKANGVSDMIAVVQGVAILKIEREGLWRQAGYDNLRAYRIDQASRLGMPKQTVSNRRKIGDAWLQYSKMLGKMKLEGHVSKLRLLDEAVRTRGDKKAVLEHFRNDTYLEFQDFAQKKKKAKKALPDVDLTIKKDSILINGHPLLQFGQDIAEEERVFISETLKAAYRARSGDCLAHVVQVYDRGEARAVENFLKKQRASR